MEEPKKVFVSIYCKIFNDSFSQDMVNRVATEQEIYDFLMRDAGMCRDDDDQIIPGDCNLWYLGCNEQFGCLKYQDKVFSWDFGESSFARVTIFIAKLFKEGIFTIEQFKNLFEKILEGRQIDCMYDIKDYLIAKREGRPWTKTKRAKDFRTDIKGFVARVERHFRDEGFMLSSPTVH
ncbi:MAG: hypothetical protein FJ123_00135 [Deltaproteobacteria bacterium]|nr:hypothetical protein [Deltaproteobacteria bacterium]